MCNFPLLRAQEDSVKFFQGFHGPHHLRNPSLIDLTYAVDIAVPIGTIVVAAHEGIVREMSMGSERYDDRVTLGIEEIKRIAVYANWILLQGDDGMQTLCCHLLKGSELVWKGQRVLVNQPLARTGLSGWIGPEPHLHFHVQQWMSSHPQYRDSRGRSVTLPFRFAGYDGSLEHDDVCSS
ncbi:MAG: M23 family metallopeptidase [Candidatus Peribacteraceae bacterium]|nr:M23 family metallopeptidase [Candidatus Peribacteraceae bacterium]